MAKHVSKRRPLQGRKTHEQHLRTLERKPDVPDRRQEEASLSRPADGILPPLEREARQAEFPVSRGGLHQESRDHNKHNRSGQEGHRPQRHGPAEQKARGGK